MPPEAALAEAPVVAPIVSDGPKLPEAIPNVTETQWSEGEAGWSRDAKTGRFVTVDKPAEPAQVAKTDAEGQPAKAGEPTDGDKESGEVAATDQKVADDADKTDPATKAAFSRLKAQLDAQAAEIAILKAPKPAEPAPRPKYDAFDSPEAYETALTEWAEAEGARKATAQARDDQVKSAQAAQAKAIADSWTQRQTAFRTERSDYDQVTGPDEAGRPLNIPMHIAVPIAQLDNGPAVEYYLGQNRAEADRIAALVPIMGAAEIGRISAKLASDAVRPAPKPKPAPAPRLGSNSGPDAKDPNDMTTEEYAAANADRLRWNARR